MNSFNKPTKKKNQISKREQAWETMFQGLVEWKESGGNLNAIPRTHKHANKCLYDWIRKQREGYRNSLKTPKLWPCLTPEKIRRFQAIGFDLTINGRYLSLKGYPDNHAAGIDASTTAAAAQDRSNRSKSYSKQWDIMYNGLVEFKARHGHLVVPKSYLCGNNKNLFVWTQAQRQYFRNYLHSAQKPTPWQDRIDRLVAIGFDLPIARGDGEEEVELLVEEEDEEPELKTVDYESLMHQDQYEPDAKRQKGSTPIPFPIILPPPLQQPVQQQIHQPISQVHDQQHQHQQQLDHLAAGEESPMDSESNRSNDPNATHDALALLAGAATEH